MIYLDNNASTALDPAVRDAMTVAADSYGNPSSVHSAGRQARRAVEESRDEIARLIGARSDEIFFTSGGTEANALAILGTVSSEDSGRIVLSAAEHPSVREPVTSLADRFEIRTVPLEPSGALDAATVLDAATPATRLVSVMAANNEYGGIYPVAEIAAALAGRNVPVHTDAV
ncbi:MAG TPA: aminotransferase class V-fold PLP-dependent enzyme, partial [Thermoanaerobaculia bacterium]|nr:aminotransferase class V-fold PLP-dependent enzyme [Thermoanaerobaculia bacterium]